MYVKMESERDSLRPRILSAVTSAVRENSRVLCKCPNHHCSLTDACVLATSLTSLGYDPDDHMCYADANLGPFFTRYQGAVGCCDVTGNSILTAIFQVNLG